MLSLLGSIQPDPFSERHVPLPAIASSSMEKDEEAMVEKELGDLLGANEEDSEDDDPFEALTRNAQAEEQRAVAEENTKSKEKKNKRKKGKSEDNNGLDNSGDVADKPAKPKKKRKKSSADE